MKRLALTVLIAVAATSCGGSKPVSISFADHPSILRGTWTGVMPAGFVTGSQRPAQNLRLTLSAAYVSSGEYRVNGTGTLGADALTISGKVLGGQRYEYLKPQYSPPPEQPHGAGLELQRAGQPPLMLACDAAGETTASKIWTWACSSPDNNGSGTLNLTKETP